MTRIIRNAGRCLSCGDVIESLHRHDFRMCTCGAVFVDGGHSYLRRGGQCFEELSEYADDDPLPVKEEDFDVAA